MRLMRYCKLGSAVGTVTIVLSLWPAASADDTNNSMLTIVAEQADAAEIEVLSGDPEVWTSPQHPIHLNRTPPLFATDQRDDGYRPEAFFQVQRGDSMLYVRLTWHDATAESVQTAPVYADAGEDHIYKQQSEKVAQFPDAACVMVPQQSPRGGAYPGLMMGGTGDPVHLYYWRAGEGFSLLQAAGRETTMRTGSTFPGHANRLNGQWSVVFRISVIGDETPVAFGIWDGAKDHRDGIKYYSLWYAIR